jgi:hypothetical protein
MKNPFGIPGWYVVTVSASSSTSSSILSLSLTEEKSAVVKQHLSLGKKELIYLQLCSLKPCRKADIFFVGAVYLNARDECLLKTKASG